jgi:hypothetical protein
MKEMERNTEERNRLPHFRRIPEFHMWSQLTWANLTKKMLHHSRGLRRLDQLKKSFSWGKEVCLLYKSTIISFRIYLMQERFKVSILGKNNDRCSPLAAQDRNFPLKVSFPIWPANTLTLHWYKNDQYTMCPKCIISFTRLIFASTII